MQKVALGHGAAGLAAAAVGFVFYVGEGPHEGQCVSGDEGGLVVLELQALCWGDLWQG